MSGNDVSMQEPKVATGEAKGEPAKGKSPGPYQPGTSWKMYARMMKIYFRRRNLVTEEEQRYALLEEVGMHTCELLDSLLGGKQPEDTKVDELFAALDKHYNPKKLVLAERYRMMSTHQLPGQSLNEYYAAVNAAAKECEFEKVMDIRDTMVAMIFVSGISNVETRKRLLEKENLSSQEALAVAQAFERVCIEAPNLHKDTVGVGQLTSRAKGSSVVHQRKGGQDRSKKFSSQQKSQKNNRSSNLNRKLCSVCGKVGHDGSKCFVRDQAFCKICKKDGHMAKACKAARYQAGRSVHSNWTPDSDEEDFVDAVRVDTVRAETSENSGSLNRVSLSDGLERHENESSGNSEIENLDEQDAVDSVPPGFRKEDSKSPKKAREPDAVDSVPPGFRKEDLVPLSTGQATEIGLPPGFRKEDLVPLSIGQATETSEPPGNRAEIPPVRRVRWGPNTVHPLGNQKSKSRRRASRRKKPKLQNSEVVKTAQASDDTAEVSRIHREPPVMLPIVINGTQVDCELDTGSAITILDEKSWKSVGSPELKPSTTKATAYNNGPITFLGQLTTEVCFNGEKAVMTLEVSPVSSHPLCGRDMIRALGIDCGPHFPSIHGVTSDDIIATKRALTSMLEKNARLFAPGLGRCTTVKANLKFKTENPVPNFRRARPVPYALRPKVDAKLEEMIQQGILKQVEHSDWATPIVVVPKPGGKIRLCGDYKVTVNSQLDIHQYPLPIPEDLFHLLNGGKKFSKMDLSDAYMQVELDEESRKYTTINTQKGLFQYSRIPFGVASAPAIFQQIMEKTLAGIDGVVIYLDDITVTGPDDATHLKRLETVLDRLNTAGFRLKRDKCGFMKERLEFLGHEVDATGIRPSPEKVAAITNMPEPQNLKEVESFIGMVQYYGKFIPNLSTLAAPLNALRKKGVEFKWTNEHKEAFRKIVDRLRSTDVLAHYNPKVPVVLATDASNYGIGAVVYHKFPDGSEKVIAYASRSLTKAERNYAQIDKEALGIVYGVEKFNQFLYGRKFTLLTDHKPLVSIFGPEQDLPVIAMKRRHRWALKLMAYSFDIEYRKTEEFGNADGLSRLPNPRELPSAERVICEVTVAAIHNETLEDIPLTQEELAEATRKDPYWSQVLAFVQNGWPAKAPKDFRSIGEKKLELSVHNGILLWGSRVVLPKTFHKKALEMLHSSHYGRNRMVALARQKIWFPGIDAAISKVAQSCETCASLANNPRKTPLHPWETPNKVWQRLHMDFAESKGGDRWLIIVDAKSKWPEVLKMNSTTASRLIQTVHGVFATHGLPEQIVSDNGPQFASSEFKKYCEKRGILLTLTPAYHPNSNGEAERFVQTFKNGLYKGWKSGKATEQAVNDLLFQYRVTEHPATGQSPAEMLMGRPLRTAFDILRETKSPEKESKYTEDMRKNHDRRAQDKPEFTVGQEVFIRNYLNHGDKWIPGIILEKTGSKAYIVHYGHGQRKVHVDQMKKRRFHWEEISEERLVRKPKELTVTTPRPPTPPGILKKTPVRVDPSVDQKKTTKRVITSLPQRKTLKRKSAPVAVKRPQRERRAPKRFQAGDTKSTAKKARINFVKIQSGNDKMKSDKTDYEMNKRETGGGLSFPSIRKIQNLTKDDQPMGKPNEEMVAGKDNFSIIHKVIQLTEKKLSKTEPCELRFPMAQKKAWGGEM